MTAILASTIRVVDGPLACLQLLERHLQRLLTANRLQTVPTVISHHMTRYFVSQQRQKHEALFRAQIRQIPYPNLVGTLGLTSFDQVPEHRQAMIRLGRRRPLRTPPRQQQLVLAQHFKKSIPAQLYLRLRQPLPQQHPHLARPQPWLQTALLLDQSRHKLSIHRPSFSQLAPRVIVLPRHSQPTAHPADAYPDGQPLQRFYRSMGGSPPTFFLNSATSLIPARSQAMRVNCRSSARSMLASANARSSARTRRFNCSVSLISSGVSTRILLPQLPLPYLRTQLGTVAAPLIPYLCRTRS